MTEKEEIVYPIRINRYLFLKGYCSRRKADKFIEQCQVKINGKVAVLGDKVKEGDKVAVGTLVEKAAKDRVYYAFYKPVGIVTHDPQKGEKAIEDITTFAKDVVAVGRLDKNSHGLVLLSNDGRIVNRLLNPVYDHEKEYIVTVDKDLKERVASQMARGIKLEDFTTKPCEAEMLGDRKLKIVLTEGKKHQIRRMCAALGYQVRDLKRVRVMTIKVGTLRPGGFREIKGKELDTFLASIGMKA